MAREKKARISKAQWLDMALKIFEKQGVAGVKIEKLANALNVAKSGFYWHFKDRQELLTQMLEYWEYEDTATVEQLLKNEDNMSPEHQLLTIMRLIREQNLVRFDLGIRIWAETDELARAYMKRVYQIRRNVVTRIFKALGFTGNALEVKVSQFVIFESWSPYGFMEYSEKKLEVLEKERLKFYLRK